MFRFFLPPALLVLFVTFPARAEAPDADTQLALRTAATLYDGIRTVTLDNGLRVYLKVVPGAPSVTTMVAYRVGSADEDLDQTGLSHYLEHLMFKGTDKLRPGDIDKITFRNGGANNAYTSEDCTIYHFDFPPDRWQAALAIEADRMRNLRIDKEHEFQQEKGAVINELMRNEDAPWDLESKEVLPLLFGKSGPYGHPVIGEREHVRAATAEIIKKHYDRWYHPNNAALVIVGEFNPDKALAEVRRLFEPIPAAKLPPRKTAPTVDLPRPARPVMASKFAVARLLIGYNTVARTDPDSAALTVLAELLTQGKTGRLTKVLVRKNEEALTVSASNNSGRYPGWFDIQAEAVPGKDHKVIEEHILAELKKLADEPPPAAELRRVQRGILASAVFARESVHGLADSIAQGVIVTDLDHLRDALPRVLAVTPEDISRVVRKYLDPGKRVTLWSLPKEDKGGKDTAPPRPQRADNRRAGAGADGGFTLQKTKRVVLPNGLVLLLFENHRLPLFVAAADVADAKLAEPSDKVGVANLMGHLLDEGTTKHTGPEISETIEGVGGVLSLDAGGGSVRVLSGDRNLGLSLLLECLMHPTFPKDAFGRVRQEVLSEIEDNETQPEYCAREAFRAAVYGPHPLGRPGLGTTKSVAALSPKDCADFHRRLFTPNNTVLAIVGDFNSQEIVDEVTRLTRDWKKGDFELGPLPEAKYPEKTSQTILSMPEAAQLHFFMGHVGIRRSDPDYYKLLVMDHVLGTGPGFTDRLSARLRDREGLAYTVSANIASSAGRREPGTFTCYIGTYNDKFDRVKKEFLEELHRIRDTKATNTEVEDAKTYLLGSLLLRFTTTASIAEQLLAIERNHLGLDYLERYRQAVKAVTVADVQEAAKKYLYPNQMVTVAAGAVDGEGKPLSPKK